jgi:A/G-specific adenine glycosylase
MEEYSLDLAPLFTWFEANKRDMPWRKNRSFYRVWISEVMLQQTQVATVIPYYKRFLARFPSASALAAAPLDEVLKLWEGLGYYSRARNLHKAAAELSSKEECPKSYKELIKISGFGPYTTAAVLSFVYGAPYAVVDGNVKRVIARFFALRDDISTDLTKKKIQKICDFLLPADKSAVFNESIMELGAIICTPKKPNCKACPMAQQCNALAEEKTTEIPFRRPRKKLPTKKAYCIIWQKDKRIFVTQRKKNEMLGGLWHFPRSEKALRGRKLNLVKHSYSHFKLELSPILCQAKNAKNLGDGIWLLKNELKNYAFDKASLHVISQLETLIK